MASEARIRRDIALVAGQAAPRGRTKMFYRGDPDRVTLVAGPPESVATFRTQEKTEGTRCLDYGAPAPPPGGCCGH
jgi:hypothetical protein